MNREQCDDEGGDWKEGKVLEDGTRKRGYCEL